jgi:hypothetical protein
VNPAEHMSDSAQQPSRAAAGMGLAGAIGSLARQLSGPSLDAELAQTDLQVEPVELTLQVVALRTGESGQSGIEWRVMSPGDRASSSVGTVHSLKLRFSSRANLGPAQDTTGQQADLPEPDLREMGDAGGHAGRAGQADPGVAPQDDEVGEVGRRGYDQTPDISAHTGRLDDGVPVVRLRCYAWPESEALAERRLVITQEVAVVPRDQTGDIDAIIKMARAARPGDDEARERLNAAVSEYVASKIDNPVFNQVTRRWATPEPLSPAGVSDLFNQSGEWLHSLVEKPFDSVGVDLGAAQPVAAVGGGVAANVLLAPVDRAVETGRLIVDVLGIAFGAVAGMPHVVVACAHDLAGIAFHEAVNRGFTSALDDLLDSKRDAVEAPSQAPGPGYDSRDDFARPGPTPYGLLQSPTLSPAPGGPDISIGGPFG